MTPADGNHTPTQAEIAGAKAALGRPAIQHITDGVTSAVIINSATPEGQAALASWSNITDEERARWAAKPVKTYDQVLADIEAAFAPRVAK